MMEVTISDLLVWLIVGLLAGSLAGLLVKRSRRGFGHLANLGLGLVGAVVGGFLFDLLRIDLGLANISVSLQDIVAALVGSLLFLITLYFLHNWYRNR
jgi:uncharacterized membrane protein YeaQ/YmgE (transglycosylase-associated protein family)